MSEPIDYVGPAYRPPLESDPVVRSVQEKLGRIVITKADKIVDGDVVRALRETQSTVLLMAIWLERMIEDALREVDDGH